MSGDEFISAGQGLNGRRHTVVGERAEPGRYSCVLAESNIAAEVTVGPSVACHRFTTRSSWSEPTTGGVPQPMAPGASACMVVELSAAGLLVDYFGPQHGTSHTQAMVGVTATITGSATVRSLRRVP
eukprot:SAG25_NODE_214_length_11695_cov_4.417400_3_plen_127_part_00